MKKLVLGMILCGFVFAVAACGDDDDSGSVDNVAACNDLQDTINGLDCMTSDVDLSCDSYDSYTCDISDYYDCVGDCYSCDGDTLNFDSTKYSDECTPLATCD